MMALQKSIMKPFGKKLKLLFPIQYENLFLTEELSTSLKQVVIKLIEKKDKDQRLIKNWHPISLLNVDSKSLANRLHDVIPKVLT